ncbi:uncharacterized protein LOC144606625 [Rhinoraja longicauda]
MAPDPTSGMFVAGVWQFPQMFLVVSIVFSLLLIQVIIVCAFCKRFSERMRGHDGQLKTLFIQKNHIDSVELKADRDTTNENGMIPKTVYQQKVTVIDETQVVQNIPRIQLTSLVEIDKGDDDSLYEVLRDIQVRGWNSNDESLREQKLDCMTQCEEVPSAEPGQKDEYNTEVTESTNEQPQIPIYAKVIKQKNKQVQVKTEVQDEGNNDEPPPIPDKHLDDEDSAP